MSDPRRIRDEAQGSFEAVLVESLRDEPSDPGAKARTLTMIAAVSWTAHAGLAQTAHAVSNTQTSVGSVKASGLWLKGGAALATKWTGIALVVGVTVSSATLLVAPRREAPLATAAELHTPRQAKLPVPAPREVEHPRAAVLEAPAAEPRLRVDQVSATASFAAPSATRSAPRQHVPSRDSRGHDAEDVVSVADPRLAREVSALSAAKRAVVSEGPGAALVRLDAYIREFPSGMLRSEADVLRIEVLSRAGDAPKARALAEAWLTREPSGAYAAKLRSLLVQMQTNLEENGITVPLPSQ